MQGPKSAWEEHEQAEAERDKLCSSKIMRYPLVPARGCGCPIWTIPSAAEERKLAPPGSAGTAPSLLDKEGCLPGGLYPRGGGRGPVVRQFDARMILADVKAAHNINISSKTTVTLVQDPIIISYWNYCNILLPSNCFPTIFLQPILQTMVIKIFYER